MDNMASQQQAAMSFSEARNASSIKILLNDFAKSLSIPQRLLSKYWQEFDRAPGEDRESTFNRVFCGLPFYVAAMPLSKSREFTSIHSLEGKTGGHLVRQYLDTVVRVSQPAAGRGVVALINVPYMDGAYVVHALNTDVVNPLLFNGGFFSMPSEQGGRMFIQSAKHFGSHPVIVEAVRKALAGM